MSKTGFAKDHLRSFIDRVERLEEEKAALAADIREVFSEAKGSGFDTKIMRQVVRMRKLDKADFEEQQAMMDLYMSALGMLGDTPLGQAAVTRAAAPSAPKESRAKVDVETAGQATNDRPVAESASRGADARSSAATSEIMDETGGERAATSKPAPTYDVTNEIPSFLIRTKPPPQPSA